MRHSNSDPSPARPRRMPRALRFPIRILSTALILALAVVLLPRLTRLVGRLWPDPARTERVSQVLAREMRDSARLETMTIDEQGVLTATVNAALIGEVQRVTIDYDYHASLGVDLTGAEVTEKDGVIILSLPPIGILRDSLTPTRIDRQDFWYPLTEKRRIALLEEEREKRAAAALADVQGSGRLQKDTADRLQRLIQSWIGLDTWLTTVQIEIREEKTGTSGSFHPSVFHRLGTAGQSARSFSARCST